MKRSRGIGALVALCLLMVGWGEPSSDAAETLDQLIAAGKKEGTLQFTSGASTFGGRRGFADIEAAFNKRYGLDVEINHTAGPSMPAMAARIATELKAGRKSSTDLYIGDQSLVASLHRQKALEKADWSEIFPWITKEMEITPGEGLLVYTSINGIVYNTNLIPKDKAPKRYEDLVDPSLSPTWAGKMAIPPYTGWLMQLAPIWGEEKVRDFLKKLVPLSAGQIRYGEVERIISGEFPIMANFGGAVEYAWEWKAKGAPIAGFPGSTPAITSYFQLAVPKNSAHPNLAKLLIAFMLSKEGQAIIQKYEFRSSHLVEGTLMANYVRESSVKLQDPQQLVDFFLTGGGAKLRKELTAMLKR